MSIVTIVQKSYGIKVHFEYFPVYIKEAISLLNGVISQNIFNEITSIRLGTHSRFRLRDRNRKWIPSLHD